MYSYIPAHNLAKRLSGVNANVLQITIGYSKNQRPIQLVSFGNGPIRILLIAFPHGNEPSGGVTALHLFNKIAIGSPEVKDVKLFVVAVGSPDTAAENEKQLASPEDFESWYSSSWELPIMQQVEFGFLKKSFSGVHSESMAIARAALLVKPHIAAVLHDEPTISPMYMYLHSRLDNLHLYLEELMAKAFLPILKYPYVPSVNTLAKGIFSIVDAQKLSLPDGRISCSQYLAFIGTPIVYTYEIPHFSPPNTINKQYLALSTSELSLYVQNRIFDQLLAINAIKKKYLIAIA